MHTRNSLQTVCTHLPLISLPVVFIFFFAFFYYFVPFCVRSRSLSSRSPFLLFFFLRFSSVDVRALSVMYTFAYRNKHQKTVSSSVTDARSPPSRLSLSHTKIEQTEKQRHNEWMATTSATNVDGCKTRVNTFKPTTGETDGMAKVMSGSNVGYATTFDENSQFLNCTNAFLNKCKTIFLNFSRLFRITIIFWLISSDLVAIKSIFLLFYIEWNISDWSKMNAKRILKSTYFDAYQPIELMDLVNLAFDKSTWL